VKCGNALQRKRWVCYGSSCKTQMARWPYTPQGCGHGSALSAAQYLRVAFLFGLLLPVDVAKRGVF
jgi:hypothetical protein